MAFGSVAEETCLKRFLRILQVVHLQKPSPRQPRAKAELSEKHILPWMDQGPRYGSAVGSVFFATALVRLLS